MRLIQIGADRDGQASAIGTRVLWHELDGNPSEHVRGRRERSWLENPIRARRHRHVHVVLDEDLNRAIDVVSGVCSRRPVD